ncbi:MAG TPA: GDP-mannose 4,6-dehydratase [Acidimicrobiales bacterium]|nr:GDP-mannose 4,6-dehydratase [Acidimicrobiales bacterium]
MRAYITGANGFVGGFLDAHLRDSGDTVTHLAAGVDVADVAAVRQDMAAAQPDVVYHLAALANVGASWTNPAETLRVNAIGTQSVVAAAIACESSPAVLLVSSAEVYGAGAANGEPSTEESELMPISPYAASKVAAEYIGLQSYLGRGLRVIRVRPFNHVGPGQSDSFVVSALARRIALAESEGRSTIKVGNLTPSRDFTDVRDVVRAYRMLAEAGDGGEVYNVCSGEPRAISDIAERLAALSSAELSLETDPELFRPADVPILVGDPTKLNSLTGWKPEYALDDTLELVLEWWRRALANG